MRHGPELDPRETQGVRGLRVRRLLALVAVAAAVPLWAACGSASAGGGGAQAKAPAGLCQQIFGVLSDGPDPGADPVGYALSQINELREIHTSDRSIGATLTGLVAADRALVSSDGSDRSASKAIAKDDDAINKVCPGVAP